MTTTKFMKDEEILNLWHKVVRDLGYPPSVKGEISAEGANALQSAIVEFGRRLNQGKA